MNASPILICPAIDLRQLPPAEVDVVRRFLFQHIRGMDREHHRRWMRLWGVVWNAGEGTGIELLHREERGGPFHRRHRVILQRLFDAQERYPNVDALHDHLKLKTWFVTWENGKPKPRSTSFSECPEEDMRQFHARMVDLLHSPYEQRHLFPNVPAANRQGMVDAVLSDQEDHQEDS